MKILEDIEKKLVERRELGINAKAVAGSSFKLTGISRRWNSIRSRK